MRKQTIKEATERWVHEYMAPIDTKIVANMDPNEITLPCVGDSVYLYKSVEGQSEGEIIKITRDVEGTRYYTIDLGLSKKITFEEYGCDFQVNRDSFLPMWSTMWSFKDICDTDWLETKEGLQAMSECGFRIYETDNGDYYFGIDGCGYDFYESHWIPLYKARKLQWHDDVAEHEYQMKNKGYVIRNKHWCDGNEHVEPILYGEGELPEERRLELYSKLIKRLVDEIKDLIQGPDYKEVAVATLKNIGFKYDEIEQLINTGYLD